MVMYKVKKIGKIQIAGFKNASNQNEYVLPGAWKNASEILYTKYNIKETDFRIKTASFTSPTYIDLTTGVYMVRISSIYHENFAGVILDVEYDPDTGLYTYQCQDWSRRYITKAEKFDTGIVTIYDVLINLLTRGQIALLKKAQKKNTPKKYAHSFTPAQKKAYKPILAGLRPLWKYDQSLYKGNKYKGNPFKKKPKIVIRDKTYIEAIRDIVYAQQGFFDVYFNDRGILQIEPISKTDWETTGLHLTTGTALKEKYKFSTTNAITGVRVNGSGLQFGRDFDISSKGGTSHIDLSAFFGWVGTSISDPTQKDKNTSSATKTNTKKNTNTNVNSDNPYGTKKKEVWMNSDSIYGQSADLKFMQDIATYLNKAGWKTHIFKRAYSESHYQHRPGYALGGQVKNGIWFTIYGGACAGTLRESSNTSYFRKPLVDAGSRTVIGFRHPPCGDIRKGGKYYNYLPRAHDDGFSGGDPYIRNCAQYLTDHAMPFMYAATAKEMAEKFLQGGDNPEACTKNWKFYNRGGYLSGGR